MAIEPLCSGCKPKLVSANTVDHVRAISDGGAPFPGHDGLASYCAACHSRKTARGSEAGAVRSSKSRGGCDANGNPLDARTRGKGLKVTDVCECGTPRLGECDETQAYGRAWSADRSGNRRIALAGARLWRLGAPRLRLSPSWLRCRRLINQRPCMGPCDEHPLLSSYTCRRLGHGLAAYRLRGSGRRWHRRDMAERSCRSVRDIEEGKPGDRAARKSLTAGGVGPPPSLPIQLVHPRDWKAERNGR